jgi:hypothetical protein
MPQRFSLVATILALTTAIAAAQPVTTATLLREMVDFERLCETPEHAYKTIQFTSYDRRSKVPGGPEWFENSDGFGGAPIPPFEKVRREPGDDGVGDYLLADIKGPGAIVRTWTANINGTIRVYLDGADEPIYDGPAERFMHRPYEAFLDGSGVAAETLRGTLYQRDAAYCPIPFAKGCRIEWTGDQKQLHFYYVQVRKYLEKDVEVETFRADDLKKHATTIEEVSRVLADPDGAAVAADSKSHEFDLKLAPGQRSKALRIKGPGALERLRLLVEGANERAALRQTVMNITCDGWSNAQVQSPVGDFFAAAPDVNPYVSLPFTVKEDGWMTSRYLMPYQKSLVVEFHNLGEQEVRIRGEANTKPRAWNDDRTMHFYARWRVTHGIATPPAIDIPFLIAGGTGRYVGTASLMMNTAVGTHQGGTWWGEGDEKVFVDGDKTPSWFGTGSEDYYNYAWSAEDIFAYPYCGQPRNDGPGNRGFVANYRHHFLDDQPFEDRIAFYLELLSNHSVEDFAYARQAYHYGRPGIIDDHVTITAEDVRVPRLPAPWTPVAHHASTGATYYEPETLTSQPHESEEGEIWSHGKLMAWRPANDGETLRLTMPVEKAGKYEVRIGLGFDKRSGVVRATLDGKPFGFGVGAARDAVDLYEGRRTMLRASESQLLELSEGEQVIELTFDDRGREDARLGVDFIWLQPR